MIQVLYAMGAMMLASLLLINQQQSIMRTKMRVIEAEVSTQATGVAVKRFEQIGALPFDEAVAGGEFITNASLLTPAADFGGSTGFHDMQDVDDAHGISQLDSLQVGAEATDVLLYQVNVSVRYVDEQTLQASASRTFTKEVILVVDSPFMTSPLTATRIFAYQPGSGGTSEE